MLCNGLLKVILKSSLERQNLHYYFDLTMSSEASNLGIISNHRGVS